MIEIGKGADRKVRVVLSNMDEPLGHAVGNANEIIEAIEFLKGNYADDLKEVVYTIASLALKEKGEVKELEEAKEKIDKVINEWKRIENFI